MPSSAISPGAAAAPLFFLPVPRARVRSDGWTPARQRGFIAALADTGSVSMAAAEVGMAAKHAYALRRHPEGAGFRAAWTAAIDLAMQRLEDVAVERAIHGTEVPVFKDGQQTGTRRVINDRLVMFLLRHRRGERYGEAVKFADVEPGGRFYPAMRACVLAEEKARAEALEEARRNRPGYETLDQLVDRLRAQQAALAKRSAGRGESVGFDRPAGAQVLRQAQDERGWEDEAGEAGDPGPDDGVPVLRQAQDERGWGDEVGEAGDQGADDASVPFGRPAGAPVLRQAQDERGRESGAGEARDQDADDGTDAEGAGADGGDAGRLETKGAAPAAWSDDPALIAAEAARLAEAAQCGADAFFHLRADIDRARRERRARGEQGWRG